MPTPLLNLSVNQGATFTQHLTLATAPVAPSTTPTPLDLTGCTGRMMIRNSYAAPSPLLTLTTENGGITLGDTEGTVDILITPMQTLTLHVLVPNNYNVKNGPPSLLYVSDLEIIYPSAQVIKYVNILIMVYAAVTK